MPDNWPSWFLVIGGGIMIIAELALGAATGFDLALLGISLAAGGGLGLLLSSTRVALFASGAFAFVYLAFFRRYLRTHLSAPDRPSNVEALIGRGGIVTVRIEPAVAGQVKVGDEVWRAILPHGSQKIRETGESVTVEAVEGVSLIVR